MPTSTPTARRNHQRSSASVNRWPSLHPIELALPLTGLPAVASS
jgi:hypothetical protein